MTRTEKLLMENGWGFNEVHKHRFKTERYVMSWPIIEIMKCDCGATKLKRGDFEKII